MADAPAVTGAPQASRGSRSRVRVVVALWAIVMISVLVASGCYGRNCEGETAVFGRNPGEGRLISADQWESSPIDGAWLPFPRQRLWFFEMPDLGDRLPQVLTPYISAQENQNLENGNFTIGTGNLAEISAVGPGRLALKNGTCADYYVRLVVQAAPRPPAAGVTPADAGVTDAAGD